MKLKSLDAGTTVLLLCSVVLNAFLATRVHELNVALNPPPPPMIAIGAKPAAVEAQDLSGKKVTVALANTDRPVVLYVFSPTCQWCAKNYENIVKLHTLKQNEYHFVGVSLSTQGLPAYVNNKKFPLDVVQQLSPANIHELHLDETPETIVIDRAGTVSKVWPGAYNAEKCREIERFFNLPSNSLSAAS